MAQGYRIADNFTLPPEAVTETFAVLARRGSGKTYTSAVLTEEFAEAGAIFAVIDPVGVWWGLRFAADGKGPGYPVLILGGEHGDLPLTKDMGEAVAELLVSQRIPMVLDLSLMRKTDQRSFMTVFAETLYFRNREALHLIIDEADLYAPQRTFAGMERLLGAIEDLVRRGRARGIGITLISQRPASLNKDVLTQAEVLIALRMSSQWDRDAIDSWVQAHGTDQERQELMSSLASMPVGEAWVWSPGWLHEFRRIRVRTRRTFDSSATPKVGAAVRVPTGQAKIDLEHVRLLLSTAPTEEAPEKGAKSTAHLEKRIKELEARLREAESRPVTQIIADPVDKAAIQKGLSAIAAGVITIERALAAEPSLPGKPSTPPEAPSDAPEAPGGIRAGERRILDALRMRHPLTMTRQQVATLARLKPSSGTFITYWGHLKRDGLLVEIGNEVSLTDAGFAAIGNSRPDTPQTPEEVRAIWRSALRAGEVRMLDALLAVRPAWIGRADLAAQAGLEPTSGTFNTYLGTLRRNGLVEVLGSQVKASEVFDLIASHG